MIRNLYRQVKFFIFTVTFATLFALAINSALKDDGIYIGHPKMHITYGYQAPDPRLQKLADALPKHVMEKR